MKKILLLCVAIVFIAGCSMPHDTETVGKKPSLDVSYGSFSGLHAKWNCDGNGKIKKIEWKSPKGGSFTIDEMEITQTPSITVKEEVAKVREITELAKQEIQMLVEIRKTLVGISDAISAGWGNPFGTAFKYIGTAAIAKYATTQPTSQPAQ